jgi:hypothetical protein
MYDGSLPPGFPLPALTAPRTVHVDSATGSDISGRGTLARPWATFERAEFEHQQYCQLRAKFTIQLHGVGPYELTSLGGGECIDDGFFVVAGDPNEEIVLASGSATGDMIVNVLPTTALAVNGFHDEFLRIKTGFYAGALFQINENAANSITVSNATLRAQFIDPFVNGDGFEIVRPGTQIRCSGGFAGSPEVQNLVGMRFDPALNQQTVRHVFWSLHFIAATPLSQPLVQRAQIAFGFCRLDTGMSARGPNIIQGGQLTPGIVGVPVTPAGQYLVYGAGMVITTVPFAMVGGELNGIVTSIAGLSFLDQGFGLFNWAGGHVGLLSVFNARVTGIDFADYLVNGRCRIANAGAVVLVQFGTWRFVLTVGSCFVVQNGGYLEIGSAFSPASLLSGGTTDAAGYGVDVRGGGRALFRSYTPTLTGGTAGSDLRTSNVAIAANAALNANGTSVAVAGDALFGEVLGRLQ